MNIRRSKFLLALFLLASVSSAHAQFGDFLRSVTGALGGGSNSNSNSNPPPKSTATIGVRGMDENTVASNGTRGDTTLLDQWASTPDTATQSAKNKGLAPRTVALRNTSPASPESPATGYAAPQSQGTP